MGFAWFVCKINGWGGGEDPLTIPQNLTSHPQPWHTNRVEPTRYFGKSTTRKYQATKGGYPLYIVPRSPRERDFLTPPTSLWKGDSMMMMGAKLKLFSVFLLFLVSLLRGGAKGFTYHHYTMCQSCVPWKYPLGFITSPTLHCT
jgi:hypothetical protein